MCLKYRHEFSIKECLLNAIFENQPLYLLRYKISLRMYIIVRQLDVHIPLRTVVKLRLDDRHKNSVGHLTLELG